MFNAEIKRAGKEIKKVIKKDKVPSDEWAERISLSMEFFKDKECLEKIPNQKVSALLSPPEEE